MCMCALECKKKKFKSKIYIKRILFIIKTKDVYDQSTTLMKAVRGVTKC